MKEAARLKEYYEVHAFKCDINRHTDKMKDTLLGASHKGPSLPNLITMCSIIGPSHARSEKHEFLTIREL